MSSYLPPTAILPIYNPLEFGYGSETLTVAEASRMFLKLTGGVETGLVTFNTGLVSIGQALIADGSSTVPGLAFNGTPDTGLYLIGAGNIGWSCGGTGVMDLTTTRLSLNCVLTLQSGGFSNTISSDVLTNDQEITIPATYAADRFLLEASAGGISGMKYWQSGTFVQNNDTNTGYTFLYSNAGTGDNDILRFPSTSGSSDTFVVVNTAQTLSNKTLSAPAITGNMTVGGGSNIGKIKYGTVSITCDCTVQGAQSTQSVSFGVTFGSAPNVFVTNISSGANPTSSITFSAGSVSTTGFVLRAFYNYISNFGSNSITVNWIAIGV